MPKHTKAELPEAVETGELVERLSDFANGGPFVWRDDSGGTDFNALRADIRTALASMPSVSALQEENERLRRGLSNLSRAAVFTDTEALFARAEAAEAKASALQARVERLEGALRFYATEWDQDVDAERTEHGWHGSIGEVTPTEKLCADQGQLARTTLNEDKP